MAKLLHIQTSHVAVARHRRQWRSKGVARQFREGRRLWQNKSVNVTL